MEGFLGVYNRLSHIHRLDNDPVTKAKNDDLKIGIAKKDIFLPVSKVRTYDLGRIW